MNLLSTTFFLYLLAFLVIYYATPRRYCYVVICIGGWIFYGWNDPSILIALVLITAWTYMGGRILEHMNTSVPYVCFFAGNIVILGVYKYTSFVLSTIVHLSMLGMTDGGILTSITAPVGVSFMIFQTCTYLGDVHHGKIRAEHDVIRYAAFVSFFPTVLSGPIQKARDLLPQLNMRAAFDADQFISGMLYFLWGVFEKICIATQLSMLVGDPPEGITAGASWYLVSAIAFSIYIYADFSGYSDMAIGIARMLGIRLERNFNNPYLSRSLSEFWTRWHISLNAWLVEYVYIPLGGNRKGQIRKYMNIMVVFLLSGLWHGASWHFVIWGFANGALVVLEQMLRPLGFRLGSILGFREETVSLRYVQRGVVCLLIGGTWLFFCTWHYRCMEYDHYHGNIADLTLL